MVTDVTVKVLWDLGVLLYREDGLAMLKIKAKSASGELVMLSEYSLCA